MMNNHLLSESCSTENYREYDAMRVRAKSDYIKRPSAHPEQCMPDIKNNVKLGDQNTDGTN